MLGNALDNIDAGENIIKTRGADQRGQNAVIAVNIHGADTLFEKLSVLIDLLFLLFNLLLQHRDLLFRILHINMEILELRINEQHFSADQINLLLQRLLILCLFAEVVSKRSELLFFLIDLLLLFLFLFLDFLKRFRFCGNRDVLPGGE